MFYNRGSLLELDDPWLMWWEICEKTTNADIRAGSTFEVRTDVRSVITFCPTTFFGANNASCRHAIDAGWTDCKSYGGSIRPRYAGNMSFFSAVIFLCLTRAVGNFWGWKWGLGLRERRFFDAGSSCRWRKWWPWSCCHSRQNFHLRPWQLSGAVHYPNCQQQRS